MSNAQMVDQVLEALSSVSSKLANTDSWGDLSQQLLRLRGLVPTHMDPQIMDAHQACAAASATVRVASMKVAELVRTMNGWRSR